MTRRQLTYIAVGLVLLVAAAAFMTYNQTEHRKREIAQWRADHPVKFARIQARLDEEYRKLVAEDAQEEEASQEERREYATPDPAPATLPELPTLPTEPAEKTYDCIASGGSYIDDGSDGSYFDDQDAWTTSAQDLDAAGAASFKANAAMNGGHGTCA